MSGRRAASPNLRRIRRVTHPPIPRSALTHKGLCPVHRSIFAMSGRRAGSPNLRRIRRVTHPPIPRSALTHKGLCPVHRSIFAMSGRRAARPKPPTDQSTPKPVLQKISPRRVEWRQLRTRPARRPPAHPRKDALTPPPISLNPRKTRNVRRKTAPSTENLPRKPHPPRTI
jgi:hypothetical protein